MTSSNSQLVQDIVPSVKGQDWKLWGQEIVRYLKKAATQSASSGTGSSSVALLEIRKSTLSPTAGLATMGNLSPGSVQVPTTSVTATSLILVTPQGATEGRIYEDRSLRVPGVSFTIVSSDPTDTPDVAWLIVELV